MRGRAFLVVLILFLLGMGGNTWGQGIHKRADEKGTIHFSNSPVSTTQKNQDQSQGKGQNINNVKPQDNPQASPQNKNQVSPRDKSAVGVQGKNQVGSQDKNQVRGQDKNQDKNPGGQVAPTDSGAVLKRLELGNRSIPKDMRKYGPAGPEGAQRRDQGTEQSRSSSGARTGRA